MSSMPTDLDLDNLDPIERFAPSVLLVVGTCRICAGRLVRSAVPCPDGVAGCLVRHHGYACLDCGVMYSARTGGL